MARKKSAVCMVFGILHLVVAGLGLTCLVIQLSGAAENLAKMGGPRNADQERLQKAMEAKILEKMPAQKTIEAVQAGVKLVLTALLIIGGIGLINMKPWGRTFSLIYAGVSILDKIGNLILYYAVLLPVMRSAIAEFAGAQAKDTEALGAILMAGGVVICIAVIYPVLVLIFMLLPSTAKALRAEDYPPIEDQFDRYEQDDRWGR